LNSNVDVARMLWEMLVAASREVGEGFRPSSFLYSRRGGREVEGVFARGLKLRRSVRILGVEGGEGFAEVTAWVPSESGGGGYEVRVSVPLDFECSCPHGRHRFNPCKHVYAVVLRLLEDAGVDVENWRTQILVYMALNKLAYMKARSSREIA